MIFQIRFRYSQEAIPADVISFRHRLVLPDHCPAEMCARVFFCLIHGLFTDSKTLKFRAVPVGQEWFKMQRVDTARKFCHGHISGSLRNNCIELEYF